MSKKIIKLIVSFSLVALFAVNTISVSASTMCPPHDMRFVSKKPVLVDYISHQFLYYYAEGKAMPLNCDVMVLGEITTFKCNNCNYVTQSMIKKNGKHTNSKCQFS